MVWTPWKSLQLRSEMSITDLRKIQSSSQTAICEELVDSLTYYVTTIFSQSFSVGFTDQIDLKFS